jgi:hypothetical protein
MSQFQKTMTQVSKASKGKKDTLPFGTFSIQIFDTKLYLRMMGWLEGMYVRLAGRRTYYPSRYNRFL